MLYKLIREPLLHFVVLGAALFLVYDLVNEDSAADTQRIVITNSDVERIISLWEIKWKRLPTAKELQGLIEAQVREEVLYREALAMGLDQDDTIVRRRMAQKVEFITDNIAQQAEPSEAELEAYLAANPEQFRIPAKASFSHIYFNRDKHGPDIEPVIQQTLSLLQNDPSLESSNPGDPFMFGNRHNATREDGVARLFGDEFSSQLFRQAIGEWQGPLQSSYGLHLVRVDSITPSSQPDLDAVREQVKQEWTSARRKQLNEAFYQQLRSRYDIIIESRSESQTESKTESQTETPIESRIERQEATPQDRG